MKSSVKFVLLSIAIISLLSLTGCGVTKAKYETLLNEKVTLEERVGVLTKANNALKHEYDSLLTQKMDLETKVTTFTNEKAALKGEYDKILDEKVALKAAYDKLLGETKGQVQAAKR